MSRVTLALFCLALHGLAEALPGPCTSDQSLEICREVYLDRAWADYKQTLADQVEENVRERPAGSALGGLSTSLLSSLPAAQLLGLGGRADRSNAPNVGLVANSRSVELAPSGNQLLMAPAARLAPELYPPLRAALEERDAAATADQLERSLSLEDALDFSVTVLVLDDVFGFSFGRHPRRYAELFDVLVAGAGEGDPVMDNVTKNLKDAVGGQGATLCAGGLLSQNGRVSANIRLKALQERLADQPPEIVAACWDFLDKTFSRAAAKGADIKAQRLSVYREARLDRFADLLSNTGQLYAQLRHAELDSLAGARVSALRLGLEWSFGPSLGSFVNMNQYVCRRIGGQPKACLDSYTEFVKSEGDKINNRDRRLSVSAEVARVGAVAVSLDLPPSGLESGGAFNPVLDPLLGEGDAGSGNRLDFSTPALTQYEIAIGYGQRAFDWRGIRGRWELGADYRYVSAAVVRNRRASAHAGLVVEAFGLGFPLQLLYVSDREFSSADPLDRVTGLAGLRLGF